MERAGHIIAVDEMHGGGCASRALPACYSIGVSEFTRWLAKAKPSDEIVYAHGMRLDGKRDVAAQARQALARQEVQLFSRRQASGVSLYIARRVAPERAGKGGVRADAAAPLPIALPQEAAAVLTMLHRFAEAGSPCPTNRQIAVKLRINDGRRVRYLIDRLERDGLISVESRGQRITRVITIAATGERTSEERTPVGLGFEKVISGGGSR